MKIGKIRKESDSLTVMISECTEQEATKKGMEIATEQVGFWPLEVGEKEAQPKFKHTGTEEIAGRYLVIFWCAE